jgi:phenylpropionate dioxygenase-like ring-hydroxylating dioxygenase large terminal subunit
LLTVLSLWLSCGLFGFAGPIHVTVAVMSTRAWWLLFLQDTWRDVPYDAASLLENVLDASHVPFTHHK